MALLLILCSYAGTFFYGPENVAKDWGRAMDGYARMADQLLGAWAGFWIRLAVLVDFTATCIGFSLAASRGIFALARSRFLPNRWAAINGHGTPQAASDIVFICGLVAMAAGFLIPSGQRYESLFVTATAQAVLLVVVYSGLALGAVRIMWKSKSEQPAWRWILFSAATIAPAVALYGTFVPFPEAPERFGLMAASGAVLAAGVWIFCQPKR